MDLRYKFELERKINELSQRRRTLEKQHEIRANTLNELGAVRQESRRRLCNAVEEQNAQAAARNQALREQIFSTSQKERLLCGGGVKSKSVENLKLAKEQYLKHVEASLPVWHRHQAVHLEESIRAIQLEKALSAKRQEQLKAELQRETAAKQLLERHRQDLLTSLAAEQRIVLESQATAILLEEESRAANAQVVSDIAHSTQHMRNAVYESVHRMREETHQLSEAAEQALRYHPPPLPRYYERERDPVTFLQTQHVRQASPEQQRFATRQHDTAPAVASHLPAPPAHGSGHGTLVRPSEEEITGSQQLNHTVHELEEPDVPAKMSISVMSPTVASAYMPRSRSSSLANHTPQHGLSSAFPVQSRQNSISYERAEAASVVGGLNVNTHESSVVLPSVPDLHTSSAMESSYSTARSPTAATAAAAGGIAAGASVRSPHSLLFGTVNESLSVQAPTQAVPMSLPRKTGSASPMGGTHAPNVFAESASFAEESVGSFKHSRNMPTSPSFSSPQASEKMAPSPRPSLTIQVEAKPSLFGNSPSKKDSFNEPSFSFGAPEDSNLSRMNSTMSDASVSVSTKGQDMSALVEGLSVTQCGPLLALLAQAIERRVTASTPVSVTTIYDTQTRHRAAHIIDTFLSSAGVEDAGLAAVLNNAADSTLGNAVLAIVEGKSSHLIPSAAFTGVMTMDKLKKEYKRAGPPGVLQLWERLIAHLQRLVEHSNGNFTFLSLCFTAVLTAHVPDGEDRSRLERKVTSLLQLALIPADNQDGRSPSPPYRARSQLDSPLLAGPASSTSGRGLYNPNISGISLSSPARGDLPVQPTAALSVKSSVLPGGNSTGSGRSGENSPPTRKEPNITSLYSKASVALRSHRTAAEFDDDEIADDETIERPPALKDLDVTAITNTSTLRPGDDSNASYSTSSDQSSFDNRPVRATTKGVSGYGGGGGGGGHGGDDEFDF